MMELSYRRHRFPPVVIQHAVWLYLRFTLSYRDIEELLAERGLDISYESVRSWVLKFGPMIARRLRQVRPRPSDRWHLDEMVVRIAGKRMYLWRAVDHEGEVLDILVQRRRDKRAALRLLRKLLKKQGFVPNCWRPTSWAPMARRSATFAWFVLMSRGSERTIALRIPIKSCGGASARCNVSSRPDLRSVFSASTPPSTTHSTFNATSSPYRRCGSSEPKRQRNGTAPLQRYEFRPALASL